MAAALLTQMLFSTIAHARLTSNMKPAQPVMGKVVVSCNLIIVCSSCEGDCHDLLLPSCGPGSIAKMFVCSVVLAKFIH